MIIFLYSSPRYFSSFYMEIKGKSIYIKLLGYSRYNDVGFRHILFLESNVLNG